MSKFVAYHETRSADVGVEKIVALGFATDAEIRETQVTEHGLVRSTQVPDWLGWLLGAMPTAVLDPQHVHRASLT